LIATQFAQIRSAIVCDHLAICCSQSTLSACCLNVLNFSLCSERSRAFNFVNFYFLSIWGVQQQPQMLSISLSDSLSAACEVKHSILRTFTSSQFGVCSNSPECSQFVKLANPLNSLLMKTLSIC
jgi:hypothetical protein